MSPRAFRVCLWLLNVVGGVAVLGSYAHGIASHADPGIALWGHLPASMRPMYQLSMLAAAAGYFAFGSFLCFRVPPESTRIAGRFGYGAWLVPHALILVPSTLWMPLTFWYVDAPDNARWIAVRMVLMLVATGSVLLVMGIATMQPKTPRGGWLAALVGAAMFAFHTLVLDALVWPALYR